MAKDLVERRFSREGPHQLWVTDITEHHTREGKLYRAAVLDTYSRRVVGRSIDSSPTAALVANTLGIAIACRRPPAGTIIHSDQGEQSGSWAFTDRAKDSRLVPSMGNVRDCFDNSMIQAFWSRMQVELLNRRGGGPGSSRPTRSSSISRSGTTAAVDTAPWAWSPR